MDRARHRRGFALLKRALMATFALAGGWKGLFDGALRHSWFLRECAAVRPVSEKQRNHHDRRTHSNLHTDRVSHHHLSFCFDFLSGCGISQFIHNPSFESYINGSDVKRTSGCSKRLSSKAAASEEARRTLRYVEPLSEARTPLADFFSILLEESGDVHPASNRFHLIRHHLASLPEGIVRRSHDQILHHFHVATFHHFGIDDDADKLHSPIGSDHDTATACCPGHGLRRGLFLYLRHLRLHRLRLLQNIPHIAERVLHSSTSFCLDTGLTSASSAPKISSACLTTGCARACSKRTSRCSFSFATLSCAIVGPEGSDSDNSTIRSR